MKIRAIILSALILCGISAVIMYSRAAQPQQKSSVITQAINDKNTPMVIKNLILKMKEQMEVNDDQFPELIKEVVLQTTFYYITDKTINERTHLNFSFDCYRINRVAGTEHSCGSQVGGRIDY